MQTLRPYLRCTHPEGKDGETAPRQTKRETRNQRIEDRNGRIWTPTPTRGTKDKQGYSQNALTLLGGWAPFCTGTEKGGLTKGSGWPAPPPRTDMLGVAKGTSTFPGSSWAEPPEGGACTGETDWTAKSKRQEKERLQENRTDLWPFSLRCPAWASPLGGGAEGTDCRMGMPGVGAVAARTLPLVEVPGGRVKRMLVVGAGPGAAALVPGAGAGAGAT